MLAQPRHMRGSTMVGVRASLRAEPSTQKVFLPATFSQYVKGSITPEKTIETTPGRRNISSRPFLLTVSTDLWPLFLHTLTESALHKCV